MGGASRWWLHHSLQALNNSLDGKLQLFIGDPLSIIPTLLAETGINNIVWNRCYEPWRIDRDKKLKEKLRQRNISVASFNASLLWEPWTIQKKDGTPYKVFTPYYRKGCLAHSAPRFPTDTPDIHFFSGKNFGHPLDQLKLLPAINWYQHIESEWQPGEAGAKLQLSDFIQHSVAHYKDERDIPSVIGTSKLSPHLHFGEVSPNQIWYAIAGPNNTTDLDQHRDTFLSELAWREFSYYLLFHFPNLPSKNFNQRFEQFPWRKNNKALSAWQQGLTGIPIVDAGMRELCQTGFMHNRVRMITASFLVKNLLVHWQSGAQWFWDYLLDADLASNSASWQWVAGSGADAAPYFRIFNPVLQGKKFDPKGDYVKHYCPELSQLPNKFIHCPWEAPSEVLSSSGITLGENYPKPIVDLKISRQMALEAFSQLKNR